MPEFRQNLATKEWVILSPERKKRPSDFVLEKVERPSLPDYKNDCPFCPGNEHMTLDPTYEYPQNNNWHVRVVPNKYAALKSDLDTSRFWVGSFLSASGYGIAEVIIEHPRHNTTLALMQPEEAAMVLEACRSRQLEMSNQEKISLVTIFKNHGVKAGTSLEHPHSQIIATPIVPPHVRHPMELAVMYYDQYGKCVYCEMVNEEIRQDKRIIIQTENFVAFCPFASRSPFECRIYPRYHKASFLLIDDNEIEELAGVLTTTLRKLHKCLDNPDYNLIIRSAPVGYEAARHLHWYMVIVPKISIRAGFEIGTGIYINIMAPEDAAACLKEIEN